MQTRRILFAAVMLLNTAAVLSAQQRIEHQRPTFAITIPVEFTRAKDPQGNLLLFAAPQGEKAVAISVKDMGMIIGLEPLRSSDLLAGSRLRIEYLLMRDIQVSVLVNRISAQGISLFMMGAQIPLRERGIQIDVIGTGDQEEGVREVLSSILSSFEGELVSPDAQQAQVMGVRRLSVRERLVMLLWSAILMLGWCSLLAYLPFRLALIGRKDALLRLRANWLAVSAVCIVVGSSIRMIASRDPVERVMSTFYALIGVMVAFLVARARGRLVLRSRQQAAAAVACSEPPPAQPDATNGQAGFVAQPSCQMRAESEHHKTQNHDGRSRPAVLHHPAANPSYGRTRSGRNPGAGDQKRIARGHGYVNEYGLRDAAIRSAGLILGEGAA